MVGFVVGVVVYLLSRSSSVVVVMVVVVWCGWIGVLVDVFCLCVGFDVVNVVLV